MNRRVFVATTCFALSLLAACSSDQSVDSGKGPTTASGVVVQVSYQGQTVPVDLGTVATSTYKGVALVKLSDVWTASKINADRSTLAFELVAGDGFKPSDKGCADIEGSKLESGYIDPATKNVIWDEALGLKGCYSVKGTAQMNGHAFTADTDAGTTDAAAE